MNKVIKKIIPEREWGIIKFETHYNKPPIDGSYPENIVKRRTLLLFAQCFLADYQTAETRKYKDFFRELYQVTMNTYFAW